MYTPAITDIAPASSIGAKVVVYIIVTNITVATQKAINLELLNISNFLLFIRLHFLIKKLPKYFLDSRILIIFNYRNKKK